MKLYEFTLNDNTNLPKFKMIAMARSHIKKEAELQRWAPNYIWSQRKTTHHANGEVEYYFEVYGDYISGPEEKI